MLPKGNAPFSRMHRRRQAKQSPALALPNPNYPRNSVLGNQAFAWNPSIRGGKVEDTVLLNDGVIENLTPTPELPVLDSAIVEGSTYAAAGVLVK